ncbi:MAG: hypothetical protein ACOYY2_03985 [Actinomycetota bacterium]
MAVIRRPRWPRDADVRRCGGCGGWLYRGRQCPACFLLHLDREGL